MPDVINLSDLEALAREKLTQTAFDYYASGAHDEITLRENQAGWSRVRLHPHVLVDVSVRDLSTSVLGQRLTMPVLVAPTAFHKLAHPEGERATARAAHAAGTIMILSSLSNTAVEEVCAGGGPVWFQLYVYRDREATAALVARAEAAGCSALVLTVDAPRIGMRERDVRNRFALPPGLLVENMVAAGHGALERQAADSGLAAYVSALLDPTLSWADIAWLRSLTRLPILLKGVLRADDARRALDCGVTGIVVSNHGGRQLDTAPPTSEVLPRVVEAVGGRCEVFVDGGVRRGTDVVKALALGARAVFLGRPVLWGLAADGQRGVERALAIVRDELDLAMALTGCPRIADITRELVAG
jgi:4-hydroxymandelate oxidase